MDERPRLQRHLLTLTVSARLPVRPPGEPPASLRLDLRVTRLDYLIAAAIALGVVWMATAPRPNEQPISASGIPVVPSRRSGRDLGA